jgi:hypothetical protein
LNFVYIFAAFEALPDFLHAKNTKNEINAKKPTPALGQVSRARVGLFTDEPKMD